MPTADAPSAIAIAIVIVRWRSKMMELMTPFPAIHYGQTVAAVAVERHSYFLFTSVHSP